MPSACGLACEICGLLEKGLCPIDGCVAGTDPRAPEKLEKFTAAMGHPCLILECAIKNKVTIAPDATNSPVRFTIGRSFTVKNSLT
jgi:hypothetical protein